MKINLSFNYLKNNMNIKLIELNFEVLRDVITEGMIMKKAIFVFGMMSCLLFVGCSTGKRLKRDENIVTVNGISLSADRIKKKKDKYFVDLNLVNDSENAVVFELKKAQCFRGNSTGTLKRAFWNAGVKTFQLESHQRKAFRAVCEHGKGDIGEYRVRFPYSTGVQAADQAKNKEKSEQEFSIEWKYSDLE
jgi:hypothetical protein